MPPASSARTTLAIATSICRPCTASTSIFGSLYHLNASEEPENLDYPKDPGVPKKFGPRGVLRSKADGKGGQTIEDTGPLTKKRMETIDEETWRPPRTSSPGRRTPASRSSAGGTRRGCTSARM